MFKQMLENYFAFARRLLIIALVIVAPISTFDVMGVNPSSFSIYMIVLLALTITVFFIIEKMLSSGFPAITNFEVAVSATFMGAVLLSVASAFDKAGAFFGQGISMYSAGPLLALICIFFVIRHLSQAERYKIKHLLVGTLIFTVALWFISFFAESLKVLNLNSTLFGGHDVSLAVWFGSALVIMFTVMVGKRIWRKRDFIFLAFIFGVVSIVVLNSILEISRPSYNDSLFVGITKELDVMPFGTGLGSYSSAFNSYKSEDVLRGNMYDLTFTEASSFLMTIFVEMGIVGVFAFYVMIFGALYRGYKHYKKLHDLNEKRITFGLMAVLFYFSVCTLFLPVGYSILVIIVILVGLVLGFRDPNEDMLIRRRSSAVIFTLIVLMLTVYTSVSTNKIIALNIVAKTEGLDYHSSRSALEVSTEHHQFDFVFIKMGDMSLNMYESASNADEKIGYLNDAISSYKKAYNLSPLSYTANIKLANAYVIAHKFTNSKNFLDAIYLHIEKINKNLPNAVDIRILYGSYMLNGDSKKGAELLSKAYELRGFDKRVVDIMKDYFIKTGDTKYLISYLESLVKKDDNPYLNYILGQAYFGNREFVKSATYLEKASFASPDNLDYLFAYAVSLNASGRKEESLMLAKGVYEKDKSRKEVLNFIHSIE